MHGKTLVVKILSRLQKKKKRQIKRQQHFFFFAPFYKNTTFMKRALFRILRQKWFASHNIHRSLKIQRANARPVKYFRTTKSIHPPCQPRVCTGTSILTGAPANRSLRRADRVKLPSAFYTRENVLKNIHLSLKNNRIRLAAISYQEAGKCGNMTQEVQTESVGGYAVRRI